MEAFINSFSSALSDSNQFLSLAALFEGSFCLNWLIELTGHKASQILDVLDEGTRQDLLIKQSGWFFAFKDLAVQEEWRERLPLKERQHWHQQIAEFLLKELPDEPTNAEAVTSHLLHVANDLKGCRWLLGAANNLRRAGSYSKALRCYTKILRDLHELRGAEIDSLFIETAMQYARISIAREDTEKVSVILQEAITKAQKLEKHKKAVLLKMHLAKNDFFQMKYGLALQHFKEGWQAIKDIDDPRFLLSVTVFQFFSYFWQGRLKEAVHSYEETVPAIEKLPLGGHPLLATSLAGYCYAQMGQFTQGLGLLDAIHKHCLEKGNHFQADEAAVTAAGIMIELRRADEALSYLENFKDANGDSDWNLLRAKLILAYAYYQKGRKRDAVHYFTEWLKRSRAVNVSAVFAYWFELCKAMEEGELPVLGGIRLKEQVQRFIEGENVLMKGVAYRYKAFLQEREGQPPENIIESLNLSVQYLHESGLTFELCRTFLDLARQHTLLGDEKTAQEIKANVAQMISTFSRDFVPDDLQWFVKRMPRDWESLCDEILKLGQDMATIRNPKQLLQVILSTANRITGAERGAVFTIDRDGDLPQIRLKASKNITSAQVNDKSFEIVMKMIAEVASSCAGRIEKTKATDAANHSGNKRILSQICVPMVIRNKVMGVLYHDNSLFINSFKESDLKLLGYFSTLAAIALDHAEAYAEIQRLNQRLNQEKAYYQEQSVENIYFEDIIGESTGIRQVLNKIRQVADTETAVLILGETGVGKDLVARAIHRHSRRNNQPFIKVLCNALPEGLITSELFGHEKGAFTGSVQRRIGRFELADGGTIFLDEIGDLQLDVQTRLLQVLQSKEFERVGGTETIRSDFRLVTATNRDLAEAVKNKRFRADLYYRLNVFPIYVPPLRERKEDIPILAYHFLKTYAARMGKTFDGISQEEMEKLMQYDWPGNIRELEGIIERGTVLCSGPHFHVPELGVEPREFTNLKADSTLRENERSHILHILEKTGWRVRGRGGAAEFLDLHYSTLFLRMRKLGIVRPPEFSRRLKTRAVD